MSSPFKISLVVFAVALLAQPQQASAQKDHKNSITIWNGYKNAVGKNYRFSHFRYDFLFPILSENVGDDYGIYYERLIKKHWIAGGGYGQWNTIDRIAIFTEREAFLKDKITFRNDYKMLDIYAGYRIDIAKRHKVSGCIGYSYTEGHNTILDSMVIIYGSFTHGMGYIHNEYKVGYHGFMSMVNYDYTLFRNRLSVGADLKIRAYRRIYAGQLLYGAHIRVNF